jgi:hypothetical protein
LHPVLAGGDFHFLRDSAMKSSRLMGGLVLICLIGLPAAGASLGKGDAILPRQVDRAAQSDAIVTGKVTEVERDLLQMAPYPGAPNKVAYKVAVVKVDEAIRGVAGKKTLRVAFRDPPPKGSGPPKSKLPKVGDEGLFCLFKTTVDGVYKAPIFYDLVARDSADFARHLADARDIAKVLADPKAALKDLSPQKRAEAAGLLIVRYRWTEFWTEFVPRYPGRLKSEPIDAEESKLILSALALADWSKDVRPGFKHPRTAFVLLKLTDKDNWHPPQARLDSEEWARAAQQWLAKHGGTYRIQRAVPVQPEKDR